jgi:hypothetical protein
LGKGKHYQELALDLTRDRIRVGFQARPGGDDPERVRRDLCRYAVLTEFLGHYAESIAVRRKLSTEYDSYDNSRRVAPSGSTFPGRISLAPRPSGGAIVIPSGRKVIKARGAGLNVVRLSSALFAAGWFHEAQNVLPVEAFCVRTLEADIVRSKSEPIGLLPARHLKIMISHAYCHYKQNKFKECLTAMDLVWTVRNIMDEQKRKIDDCAKELRFEITELRVRALTKLVRFTGAEALLNENLDLASVVTGDLGHMFTLLRYVKIPPSPCAMSRDNAFLDDDQAMGTG